MIPGPPIFQGTRVSPNGMDGDDVSSSSFFDLKVEVLKRKREAEEARRLQSDRFPKRPPTQRSSEFPRTKADKFASPGLSKFQLKKAPSDDDAEVHAKSRAALEAKSHLYERLQANELSVAASEEGSSYLVDFDRKGWDPVKQEIIDPPTDGPDAAEDPINFICKLWSLKSAHELHDDERELVEYTDEFGRTRKIRASEKAKFDAEREETIRLLDNLFNDQGLEPKHYDPNWEVRDKGVGFFAFSSDSHDRQRQLQALKELRQNTVESRARAVIAREERRLRREERRMRLQERKVQASNSEGSVSLFASLLLNT